MPASPSAAARVSASQPRDGVNRPPKSSCSRPTRGPLVGPLRPSAAREVYEPSHSHRTKTSGPVGHEVTDGGRVWNPHLVRALVHASCRGDTPLTLVLRLMLALPARAAPPAYPGT